jgi:hypothetical protein
MLTNLFATSDLARRVAERSLEMGSITFSYPKKPIGFHAQRVCEGLKFVVKDMAVVVFDFGNGGPVELDSEPSEPP